MNKEFKWEHIQGGRRKVYKTKCNHCDTIIWKRKSQIELHDKHYCNLKCLGKSKTTLRIVQCAKCLKDFNRNPSQISQSKSGLQFCTKSCSVSYWNSKIKFGKNHPNWKNGSQSYRARALRYYDAKCVRKLCPFKNIDVPHKMLDVDHIDKNRSNNNIENLQVLCVWCHALKTRKLW